MNGVASISIIFFFVIFFVFYVIPLSLNTMKNNTDNREINRKYNESRGQYKLAAEFFKDIPDLKNKRILDIGAGMGEFANFLKSKGANPCCVDVTNKCCDNLKNMGFETYEVNLENQKLPFLDNEFDVALSLEVIEHIWNTENYLNEIQRVLKPNGYVIFTTTNYNNWRFRALSLLGKFDSYLLEYHRISNSNIQGLLHI